jgi:hypothetical protein
MFSKTREMNKKPYVFYMKWGEKWQKRSITVNFSFKGIPLIARIFGRRIYNFDEKDNVKVETYAILFQKKVYIYGAILTETKEVDGPPRKEEAHGQDED